MLGLLRYCSWFLCCFVRAETGRIAGGRCQILLQRESFFWYSVQYTLSMLALVLSCKQYKVASPGR